MSAPSRGRRHRTHVWLGFYTVVLFAIFALSLATHQWSVALTTLGIGVLFALFTRRLWRKR